MVASASVAAEALLDPDGALVDRPEARDVDLQVVHPCAVLRVARGGAALPVAVDRPVGAAWLASGRLPHAASGISACESA